jgi:transcriptional regulator with XRE-family HTH domain
MKSGDMIAQLRLFRGKSRKELADLLGVSKQRMSALESASDVSLSMMQRICSILEFEMIAFPIESRPAKQSADITLSEPEKE